MGWGMQKISGAFLICHYISVRFDLSVETHFLYLRFRLLASQIREDMWKAIQNLCGFLPAIEIKKGTDDLSVLAGGRLNCPVHITLVEVRLRKLLHDPQMRTRSLQFSTIKVEVVGC